MPARLQVKVVPKAAKDEVVGWVGEALKVRVKAAPERGKANEAVLAALAAALKVPRQSLRLITGTSSERKIIEVHGLAEAELNARLGKESKEKR